MAEFTAHAPGTFSWPELSTTDQKAAVAFYRALFGWAVSESPMGPTEVYSTLLMRGKPVGAAYTMRPEERQAGAPPHWNAYVTVANADETVKKAESIGAEILNELGALCWTELNTRDTKAAEAFYTALFGWGVKHSAAGAPMEYTEFSVAGTPSIGMMPMVEHLPKNVPSYWMPYFQVADAEASVAKVKELGGTVMVPPQDIPNTGRFVIVSDPQGAMFAVFKFAQG